MFFLLFAFCFLWVVGCGLWEGMGREGRDGLVDMKCEDLRRCDGFKQDKLVVCDCERAEKRC